MSDTAGDIFDMLYGEDLDTRKTMQKYQIS